MAARVPAGVTITYERKRIRCGKSRCRCNTRNQAAWHGPYWYGFWWDSRAEAMRCFYVGKNFDPPTVTRRVHSERRRAPAGGEERARSSQSSSSSQDARDAEVLGVSPHASADEVRRAWKKLAAANHPDRAPPSKRHHQEEIAKQINAAYERFRRRRGWG
jgi:hypothetical protein